MKKILFSLLLLCSIYFSSYAQIKTTVEFVVNKDEIIYNENYDYFIEQVIPYIQFHAEDIESILLVGSASPEGTVKRNIYLANIRANKIYSYFSEYLPRNKIVINNKYSLFLEKTNLTEDDYTRLRATYIEVQLKTEKHQTDVRIDTVFIEKQIEKKDTVHLRDTVLIKENRRRNLVLSVYNDLTADFLKRVNLGTELYFNKMSFFVEGSFSNWTLVGKNYNIDFWTTGFRKYFNENYNKIFAELYLTGGYFDTDLFWENSKFGVYFGGGIGLGYAFDLCYHWKICPIIRFGFDTVSYNDYYYLEQGDVEVSFGIYKDGRKNTENTLSNDKTETNQLIQNSKTITRDFFNNCNKLYWFGPTYFGITIKRDFCINKKLKTYEKF